VRALEERGEWEDTLVSSPPTRRAVGRPWLKEKLDFFLRATTSSALRDPHSANAGRVITHFSENVDLLPTLADVLS